MYTIKEVKSKDIQKIIEANNHSLTAPMDDMWEHGIIPSGTFFSVEEDKKEVGYFVLDNDNIIMAYYVVKGLNSKEIFDFIVKEKSINKAYVSSYDPQFYENSMRLKKEISDNTFLYKLGDAVKFDAPFEGITRELGNIQELEEILEYFVEATGPGGDWLRFYVTNLIENNSLYIFKFEGKIIGSGEIRQNSRKEFANVGMVVAPSFRKKGLATFILSQINEISKEKNITPVCSTTIENIGSQKALLKTGFICDHKIYTVTF